MSRYFIFHESNMYGDSLDKLFGVFDTLESALAHAPPSYTKMEDSLLLARLENNKFIRIGTRELADPRTSIWEKWDIFGN